MQARIKQSPLHHLTVLLGLLSTLGVAGCGAFGLSRDDRDNLAQHQERAVLYYESYRIPQALDQVRQGLEIDGNDYKLLTVRGYCVLRQANDPAVADTPARRRALLEEAQRAFEVTMAQRPLDQHGPQALLGDALMHEELARWKRKEITGLQDEQAKADASAEDRGLRAVRLQELELQTREHLLRAERNLNILLTRGDALMLAHKHMLSLQSLRGNYQSAVMHGNKFLDFNRKEQERVEREYRTTTTVGYEREMARALSRHVEDEITTRTQLASLHFNHDEFSAAVEQLDRVLMLAPTRAPDYYNRAVALHKLDRFDEAYRDVQKFLATHNLPAGHPTVKKAHELLRQVEQRRP